MDVRSRLEEAEAACATQRRAKEVVNNSLRRAEAEIMELHHTTGRLQLELKCALNEKESCEY